MWRRRSDASKRATPTSSYLWRTAMLHLVRGVRWSSLPLDFFTKPGFRLRAVFEAASGRGDGRLRIVVLV